MFEKEYIQVSSNVKLYGGNEERQNKTNDFKVKLPYPLKFNGQYQIALHTIIYPVSWPLVGIQEEPYIDINFRKSLLHVPNIRLMLGRGGPKDLDNSEKLAEFLNREIKESITDFGIRQKVEGFENRIGYGFYVSKDPRNFNDYVIKIDEDLYLLPEDGIINEAKDLAELYGKKDRRKRAASEPPENLVSLKKGIKDEGSNKVEANIVQGVPKVGVKHGKSEKITSTVKEKIGDPVVTTTSATTTSNVPTISAIYNDPEPLPEKIINTVKESSGISETLKQDLTPKTTSITTTVTTSTQTPIVITLKDTDYSQEKIFDSVRESSGIAEKLKPDLTPKTTVSSGTTETSTSVHAPIFFTLADPEPTQEKIFYSVRESSGKPEEEEIKSRKRDGDIIDSGIPPKKIAVANAVERVDDKREAAVQGKIVESVHSSDIVEDEKQVIYDNLSKKDREMVELLRSYSKILGKLSKDRVATLYKEKKLLYSLEDRITVEKYHKNKLYSKSLLVFLAYMLKTADIKFISREDGRISVTFNSQYIESISLTQELYHILGFNDKKNVYSGDIAMFHPDLRASIHSFVLYELNGLLGKTIFGDDLRPVLRHVTIRGNYGDIIEEKYGSSLIWVPISAREIQELHFQARTTFNSLMPFQWGSLYLTLVVKKVYK